MKCNVLLDFSLIWEIFSFVRLCASTLFRFHSTLSFSHRKLLNLCRKHGRVPPNIVERFRECARRVDIDKRRQGLGLKKGSCSTADICYHFAPRCRKDNHYGKIVVVLQLNSLGRCSQITQKFTFDDLRLDGHGARAWDLDLVFCHSVWTQW